MTKEEILKQITSNGKTHVEDGFLREDVLKAMQSFSDLTAAPLLARIEELEHDLISAKQEIEIYCADIEKFKKWNADLAGDAERAWKSADKSEKDAIEAIKLLKQQLEEKEKEITAWKLDCAAHTKEIWLLKRKRDDLTDKYESQTAKLEEKEKTFECLSLQYEFAEKGFESQTAISKELAEAGNQLSRDLDKVFLGALASQSLKNLDEVLTKYNQQK